MPEVAWIALYALGALVSIPFIARSMYEPDGGIESSKHACTAMGITSSLIWPLFAAFGLIYLISKWTAPLIFGTGKKRGEQ